jgi:hypothetical protein
MAKLQLSGYDLDHFPSLAMPLQDDLQERQDYQKAGYEMPSLVDHPKDVPPGWSFTATLPFSP